MSTAAFLRRNRAKLLLLDASTLIASTPNRNSPSCHPGQLRKEPSRVLLGLAYFRSARASPHGCPFFAPLLLLSLCFALPRSTRAIRPALVLCASSFRCIMIAILCVCEWGQLGAGAAISDTNKSWQQSLPPRQVTQNVEHQN
jgi:hypothetical protein